MINASLTVVGSGIKFMSHLTMETKPYIEKSDAVLYLVNDPAVKMWIEKVNPKAESLYPLYTRYPLRLQCYRAITDYILEILYNNKHVCVVLYGHPAVFAQPALEAVIKAKASGYDAKILPGISAEDCLFSDLLINPGACGCQSYEATDFLIYQRNFDVSAHLILWQAGSIGILGRPLHCNDLKGIKILQNYLSNYYKLDHMVTIYEAAQYPCFEPRIDKIRLSNLANAQYSSLSTLYIPPASKKDLSQTMLDALGINIRDLQ